MIDLGQVPARPVDRQRAAAAAAVIVLIVLLAWRAVGRPIGVSFPLLALVIGIAVAMLAMATALLWAQARVTRSVALLFLAATYAGTALLMVPYLALYRGLFPELARVLSADAQTPSWLWLEWHVLLAASPAVYALARRMGSARDAAVFQRLQYGVLAVVGAATTAIVAPTIWIDGLPAIFRDGRFTALAAAISVAVICIALGALVILVCVTRLRSVLDLWLAVSGLCLVADVTLSTSGSAPFTLGWYLSRCYILAASGIVFAALVIQTARVYALAASAAERMRGESLTDALTGIPNRRNLDVRLDQIVADGRRSMRPVGVLMIDIDHFKMYNDTLGHQAGDDALRHVATTLADNVNREQDVVARFGGEEFAVVLPGTEPAGALLVAERLRLAVERTGVTISIGVAVTIAEIVDSPDDLLARADRSLYHAKGAGRNRVCYKPTADEVTTERVNVASSLTTGARASIP